MCQAPAVVLPGRAETLQKRQWLKMREAGSSVSASAALSFFRSFVLSVCLYVSVLSHFLPLCSLLLWICIVFRRRLHQSSELTHFFSRRAAAVHCQSQSPSKSTYTQTVMQGTAVLSSSIIISPKERPKWVPFSGSHRT